MTYLGPGLVDALPPQHHLHLLGLLAHQRRQLAVLGLCQSSHYVLSRLLYIHLCRYHPSTTGVQFQVYGSSGI